MSIQTKIRQIVQSVINDIESKTKELESLSNRTKFYVEQARKEMQAEYAELVKSKKTYLETLEFREKWVKEVIESDRILHLSAEMYADVNRYIFEDAENYLRYKPYPSIKGAEVVREMRREASKHMKLYREWQYKIEVLKGTFPEISRYIEDESNSSVLELSGFDNYEGFKEVYDRRQDYISKDEWAKLSETEKSQLALDRYNKKDKSNWVIGVEYEMYVEYLLRLGGYNTIPHGSLKRLSDLGRDVIATKVVDGKLLTYIIQCKRYGAGKEIHENTICQLYGTTMEYEFSNQSLFDEIIPCLYTTVPLSGMAQKFAERLGVRVVPCRMGKYPQIKCNISSTGEKIYHLPFDQQYYNTIIDKEGEFYAWNVDEAERAGFRRARKYIQ